MRSGISEITSPLLLALLAILLIGSNGDMTSETSTTDAKLKGNSTALNHLTQEPVDESGESRSLGLLKLKLKRTKSSYKAAKPKGQYGAPKAQYGPPKTNNKAPENSAPSYIPPVQSSSSNSHSIFTAAAYIPPSYNPPSYNYPPFSPPSYSPPSYYPPLNSPPSYNPLAPSFYIPQEQNTAENSGALHNSDALSYTPASYENSAYSPPAYIESTDGQQQDYSAEHNNDPYAPVSGPEYYSPYQHGDFSYPESNEDSGEDFFTSSNDFPTFDEFLKQNTFNFPNFKI